MNCSTHTLFFTFIIYIKSKYTIFAKWPDDLLQRCLVEGRLGTHVIFEPKRPERMQHHIETIVKKRNGYAGICPCCGNYNIAFKNMLFNLSEQEFSWFANLLTEKRMMCDFPTSHGKELLLPTPMPNFSIMLTYDEIDELLEMMSAVKIIVDARKILGLI